MKRALIDPVKCRNCPDCAAEQKCPLNAIFREESEKPWIDFYMCSGCMKCKPVCRFEAISLIVQPCTIRGRTTF